jgi:hypothetical protein
MTATYIVYTRAFYLVSGRLSSALLGALITFFLFFGRHRIIRPEIFGDFALAVLIWLVVRAEPWRSRSVAFSQNSERSARRDLGLFWIGIPLTMVVWANVHGSFAIGLIFLGCHALGQSLLAIWEERSVWAAFRNPWSKRWILVTELAFAMTLINPYGLDLLIETIRFGQNPNLRDILEWYRLELVDLEGIQFGLANMLMVFLYRFSRQRIRPTDVILLVVFSIGIATAIRIIGWYAAIFSLCMMPHISDLMDRLAQRRPWRRFLAAGGAQGGRKFGLSLLALLLIWCAIVLSPFGSWAVGGKAREPEELYAQGTPFGISEFFRHNPTFGLIYAPQWWSDWLVWDGPKGLRTVVSTNVHMAPTQVWEGYMQVCQGRDYWNDLLKRWHVQAVVVDKAEQEKLTRLVRGHSGWEIVYEDEQGIVAIPKEAGVD